MTALGKSGQPGSVSFVSESSEEIEIQREIGSNILVVDRYVLCMIRMGTMEELRIQNYTLALYCLSCDRWGAPRINGRERKHFSLIAH